MRLWHYKILNCLPDSQILSQKRECDLIWKDVENEKKTNHILINYIWEYEDYIRELSIYYRMLKDEFERRGFRFNPSIYSYEWADNFAYPALTRPFEKHHNDRYLLQCFYNLQEKYDRGQKDFSLYHYQKLIEIVKTI